MQSQNIKISSPWRDSANAGQNIKQKNITKNSKYILKRRLESKTILKNSCIVSLRETKRYELKIISSIFEF